MTTIEETENQVVETTATLTDETLSENKEEIEEKLPNFEQIHTTSVEIDYKPKERQIGPTETSTGLPEFKFGGYIRESHGEPIMGIEFCKYLRPGEPVIFATVGGNNVTIYECEHDKMKLLQSYSEPDRNELLYTCCWTYNPNTLRTILASAGQNGVIRLIYPASLTSKTLIGHMMPIYDLKAHPKNPSILLSASGDQSLRLWNIESGCCIAVLGGADGHKDQVASCDFNSAGSKIISGGGDCVLKIWHIDQWHITKFTESSYSLPIGRQSTVQIHYPDETIRDVHNNFVDCVKWFGSCFFSKTNCNAIVCSIPGQYSTNVLHRFNFDNCESRYTRFAVDSANKYMAIGNSVGKIYVWSLDNNVPTESVILKHRNCTKLIRQLAFSEDGKTLIGVSVDSKIFRWNMK